MTYEEPVEYGTIRHQRQGSLDNNRVPVPGLGGYLIGAANDVFVNEPSEENDDEAGLPPADHGKQAWLFLIGCFWLEGLLWGLPFSFGVFEKYYTQHEPFASQPGVPAIGTTGLGLAYFIAPFAGFSLQRWPAQRKKASIFGLTLIVISLLAASYATSVAQLILTQGVLYGIGGSLLYNPYLFYLDEWFIRRKGMAYGIFFSGTGLFGAFIPAILEWGLDNYGFRLTLQIWALVVGTLLSLLVYFLKPRRPLPTASTPSVPINVDFLSSARFWIFMIGNIVEGAGYFMPQIYLPSFAEWLNFPPIASTMSISILNVSSTLGLILTGLLVDRLPISIVLLISSLGAAASIFLLWGFSVTEPILYIFALTYGIFAGGYGSTWSGSALEVNRDKPRSDLVVIMNIIGASRGFGCVASGPVSEWLLRIDIRDRVGVGAYGTKYASLIIFTGITAILSIFGMLGGYRNRRGTNVKRTGPAKVVKNKPANETRPLIPE